MDKEEVDNFEALLLQYKDIQGKLASIRQEEEGRSLVNHQSDDVINNSSDDFNAQTTSDFTDNDGMW